MFTILSTSALAASAVALALIVSPASAETVTYTAELSGKSEVPPNDSQGTGSVEATYDTESKMLNWTITYSNLTGEATAAHFHGPAAAGANAGPVVPIEGSVASPIKGSATLTDAQAADLGAGMWYFNIHTAQYPDGELRGQLAKQ
ncbi:MAG TPA: CHRD domain-containing protein [Bauldia sp.]|nr:CHRD domain-containing protein [Bauldia sp.]